jgi:hypothetical protein
MSENCPRYEAFVAMCRHMVECDACQSDANCKEYNRLLAVKESTMCSCGQHYGEIVGVTIQ